MHDQPISIKRQREEEEEETNDIVLPHMCPGKGAQMCFELVWLLTTNESVNVRRQKTRDACLHCPFIADQWVHFEFIMLIYEQALDTLLRDGKKQRHVQRSPMVGWQMDVIMFVWRRTPVNSTVYTSIDRLINWSRAIIDDRWSWKRVRKRDQTAGSDRVVGGV